MEYTETLQKILPDVNVTKPHVLLLGAGASLAAFPEGDAFGKKLPLMNNLIKIVGLEKLLRKNKIQVNDASNFEELYASLYENETKKDVVDQIEEHIKKYFSALKLPEHPTLYDHLILCLRKKDVIATFNWDPFLIEAAQRIFNTITDKIPSLLFLHGNIRVGYDTATKKIAILNEITKFHFKELRLLFPINQKNYNDNPAIKSHWQSIQRHLKQAVMFTVFGYSAPKSDIEAKKILQTSWDPCRSYYAEIEIIDIISKENLQNTWKDFIVSDSYQLNSSFYESFIAKYPRRSCEAARRQNMGAEYLDEGASNSLQDISSFEELKSFYMPFIDKE